jgi:outer membrane lipoprotein-sorting protein
MKNIGEFAANLLCRGGAANRPLTSLPSTWGWLLVALVPIVVSAAETSKDELTAKDIIERMAKVYAGAKWYRDSGVVEVQVQGGADDSGFEEEVRFTTAFARPDHFRFEYSVRINEKEFREVIWRNGKAVQTWLNPRFDIEKPDSLSLAIAGATGVSNNSAHTVPHLLLPDEVVEWRKTGPWDLQRIEDAYVGDVECFRVSGKTDMPADSDSPAMAMTSTVWIEKRTFLLRRIDSTMDSATLRSKDTTTYEPVIDEEIPDRLLEFGVPKEN